MPVGGRRGDVVGHHDRGAAQEPVRRGDHAADPDRDQAFQPTLMRLHDQRHRVRATRRETPVAQCPARHLVSQGLPRAGSGRRETMPDAAATRTASRPPRPAPCARWRSRLDRTQPSGLMGSRYRQGSARVQSSAEPGSDVGLEHGPAVRVRLLVLITPHDMPMRGVGTGLRDSSGDARRAPRSAARRLGAQVLGPRLAVSWCSSLSWAAVGIAPTPLHLHRI